MLKLAIAAILFVMLSLTPFQVQAQQPQPFAGRQTMACDHRGAITGYLQKKFSEQPVAAGLGQTGVVVELWTNKDQTTWTIVLTRPDGITCLIIAGENWETLPITPAKLPTF